jgi:hypothetical protein
MRLMNKIKTWSDVYKAIDYLLLIKARVITISIVSTSIIEVSYYTADYNHVWSYIEL